MKEKLANLIFPNAKEISYYEEKYKLRDLDDNAIVTRFGPSPTGFVHMGSLYTSFLASRMAKQSNGVFYVRIEDTDQEREVENGVEGIFNDLRDYEIPIDESMLHGGDYGPYIQSERREIYESFAKELIKNDLAYPCFASEDDLKKMREIQETSKERLGYYGRWATYRNKDEKEQIKLVEENKNFVIRLKSRGDFNIKHKYDDAIKGEVEYPENDHDIVLIKSDGLPTYHFAHVVDDHLMRTTHVIRGDEWLSSLPIHLELFSMFEFVTPKYAHVAPLNKNDNGTTRKLSKRKDPEASVKYYHEEGIPLEAVKIFLSTLGNTDFEEWFIQNPEKSYKDFEFKFNKMPIGGTLFDIEKLESVTKTYLSTLSAEELYNQALVYFNEYDNEFYNILKDNKDYSIELLNIEREGPRPRKDIGKYKDIKHEFWYMFDILFDREDEKYKDYDLNLAGIEEYLENVYSDDDTKEEWFRKVKEHCSNYGYSTNRKEYKENPEKYLGQVGDFCNVLRIASTTKDVTPDLYQILKLLSKDKIKERVEKYKNEKGL